MEFSLADQALRAVYRFENSKDLRGPKIQASQTPFFVSIQRVLAIVKVTSKPS